MLSLSDFPVDEGDEGLEQDDGDADETVDDEVRHDDRGNITIQVGGH